ncbi:unnamed protein product [Protopolystoma xenopodis]|uniref:TAP-C domain-containing protein n=1 Tax=Protopolystoma xenopodis TaxID=117903 RepID=A0A3S5B3S4_9PLAT|nr:unnamed protein product [Protopolystoma xenopodis]
MPRSYKIRRNRFRWNKSDLYDDVRYEADSLHNYVPKRHDRAGKARNPRRSNPSNAFVKHAVQMNLVQNNVSPPSHSTGLMQGEIWVRVRIVSAAGYSVDWLREALNSACGTQFRLYNIMTECNNRVVFIKMRQRQLPECRKMVQSVRDPIEGKPLVIDLTVVPEPSVPSPNINQDANSEIIDSSLPTTWLEALQRCFVERFQATSACLDLSSLHTDPTLLSQGLYLPLNKSSVADALVNILRQNNAKLSSLNLASNRLSNLYAFSGLWKSGPCANPYPAVSIQRLDLSANPLSHLNLLLPLRGIQNLVELDLSDTPVMLRNETNDKSLAAFAFSLALYVVLSLGSIDKTLFPSPIEAEEFGNGQELPATIQFAVEQGITTESSESLNKLPLPESVLGYFPNDTIRLPLLTFLKGYLNKFDMERRGEHLLPYYSANSVLTISTSPFFSGGCGYSGLSGSGGGNNQPVSATITMPETGRRVLLCTARLPDVYLSRSRNLLRCRDETRRRDLIARGTLGIASQLDSLPCTEHLLDTLSIDVIFHSVHKLSVPSISSAASSCPANRPAELRKVLRCFSRTMILVAPEGHIIQEDFIISNPSHALVKKHIFDVEHSAKMTIPLQPSKAGALEAPVTPASNLPTSATSRDDHLRLFCQRTGMNEAFARQCLEEYQWDFARAAESFDLMHAAGSIPAAAFVR